MPSPASQACAAFMICTSQHFGPGLVACSCHIVVAEQSIRDGQQVLRSVVQELEHRFAITHTTVQIEVEAARSTTCTASRARRPPARSEAQGSLLLAGGRPAGIATPVPARRKRPPRR